MIYFTSDFTKFFEELTANNNRDWFLAHKKRYEKTVKAPFEALVSDLIRAMQIEEPEMAVLAKDCIFRINRDVRFSKNKDPYKTRTTALITPHGRKGLSHPGLYIELSANGVGIFGGAYAPDKEQLQDIRWHIIQHPEKFKNAISDPDFVAAFGQLQGEKNKRLPPDFVADAEKEPWLYNKQFYYNAQLPTQVLTEEGLVDGILNKYNAAKQIRHFLRDALFS